MLDEDVIKFECPHCCQSIEAPTSMRGMEVECPGCTKKVKAQSTQLPAPRPASHIPSGFWRVATIFIAAFPLLVGGVYLGNRLSQPSLDGWTYLLDFSAAPNFSGEDRFKEAEAYAEGMSAIGSNGWELVGFVPANDGSHALYRIRSSIAERQGEKLKAEMAKQKPEPMKTKE